jgi:hypothetical protein
MFNGFALRVEDALLQRYKNFNAHLPSLSSGALSRVLIHFGVAGGFNPVYARFFAPLRMTLNGWGHPAVILMNEVKDPEPK